MKSIDIYHGSDKEIIEPKLYACKTDNDFGSGFLHYGKRRERKRLGLGQQ